MPLIVCIVLFRKGCNTPKVSREVSPRQKEYTTPVKLFYPWGEL